MKTNQLLLTALLACLLSPALAEEELAVPAGLEADAPHPREEVPILHRRHGTGQPVKNAPYSARAVSERLQQLSDGNQIERRTSAASYRDSAGRTRQEVRGRNGEVQVVTIHDPVANAVWILSPRTRTAQKLPSHADIARTAGAAARARIEQLRKEGRLPRLEREAGVADKAGERTAVHVERENDGRREIVRVIRIPRGPGQDTAGAGVQPGPHFGPHFGPAIGPQLGTIVANAAGDMKWASKATSRDLGTRDFDGVRAEGKLRSYEIPAGEVGNRNPIVVADETWYSPDLQITVYSKHSDPRSGDYVYRLEGLKRGEPDAALFTVPSDYKVREAGELRRELRRELHVPGKKAE
ncbi:hypothetical protein [Massilia niabensis]|uniref:Uncharacterized protein n=1 Tax=Massilia niabensis TaxID=544910 RepID=A0ABW0L1L9_9BURK